MSGRLRLVGGLLLLGLLLLVGASPAAAATYYIAPTSHGTTPGDDARSCATAQNISTPRATIKQGIACMTSAGDTLYVRGGTYTELGLRNPFSTPGTSSAYMKVHAYNGETVLFQATAGSGFDGYMVFWADNNNQRYIEFDGINLDDRNTTGGMNYIQPSSGIDPHHIRFKNATWTCVTLGSGDSRDRGACNTFGAHGQSMQGFYELINITVTGGGKTGCTNYLACGGYPIYMSAPNSLVEGCDISDFSMYAIHGYNSGGTLYGTIFRNNRIHGPVRTVNGRETNGILILNQFGTPPRAQVYNNLLYDLDCPGNGNGACAAIATYNGANIDILHNTGYDLGTGFTFISIGTNTQGAIVKNNGCASCAGSGIVNNGTGTVQGNNLINPATPGLVNAAGGDFHLTEDSNFKDAGETLAAFATDFDGNGRPNGSASDIGPFEWQEPANPPTPPTIEITSPADGSQSAALTITVAGTYADGALPVTEITWSVGATGGTCTFKAGEYSCADVLRALGLNTITVTASDGTLIAADSIEVERLAATAPSIAVLLPHPTFYGTTEGTITVSGTAVAGTYAITGVGWTNGVQGGDCTFGGGTFTCENVTLTVGETVSLTVTVSDGVQSEFYTIDAFRLAVATPTHRLRR